MFLFYICSGLLIGTMGKNTVRDWARANKSDMEIGI